MVNIVNPVDSNDRRWMDNQTSPDEFPSAIMTEIRGSWLGYPQGALQLTETFEQHTLPASGQGNIGVADETLYDGDGNRYTPMPGVDYASRETSGVGGTLPQAYGNVQEHAIGQELSYDYSKVSQTTKFVSALNRSGSEYPRIENYGSARSSAESFAALDLSRSLDDGSRSIRRSLSSKSEGRSKDPVICGNCGQEFKGIYANGNYTRHQKTLKCASSINRKEWPCAACSKVYQRSDALLKHIRKVHSAPMLAPEMLAGTTPGSV